MSIQSIPPVSSPTTAGQLAARATQNDQILAAAIAEAEDRLSDVESRSGTYATQEDVAAAKWDRGQLTASANLDAMRAAGQDGFYYVTLAADATTLGLPEALAGVVRVETFGGGSTGQAIQTYVARQSNRTWTRSIAGGAAATWSPWTSTVTSTEVASVAADVAGALTAVGMLAQNTPTMVGGTNLLATDDAAVGYRIDANTGQLAVQSSRTVSRFIPVTPGATYTSALLDRKAFYRADKSFIVGATDQNNGTFTVPAGAVFARFQTLNTNWGQGQVNAGATLLPFEPYSRKIIPSQIPTITAAHMGERAVTPEATVFASSSLNLINPATALYDVTIPIDGTEFEPYPGFVTTAPIPVTPGESFTMANTVRVSWFDANGVRVGGRDQGTDGARTTAVSAGAVYARWFLWAHDLGSAMVVRGTEMPAEWTPGGYRFAGDPASVTLTGPDGTLTLDYDGRSFQLDTDATGVPDTALDVPVPAEPFNSNRTYGPWGGVVSPETFNGYYADLATAHPGYVTGEQIAIGAGTTSPVYRYDFKPAWPAGSTGAINNKSAPVKIIVFGGVHGHEKQAANTVYNFFDNLCNNWQDDPVLEVMRFNVHWIVFPLVNPGGWMDGVRVNRNGVDLARNYPAEWANNTAQPGDSTYGGPAPLSEPEAAAIYPVLEQNKDAFALLDFHNFTNPYTFFWHLPTNTKTAALVDAFYRRMDRMWKPANPWMHQDYDNPQMIGSSGPATVGSPSMQGDAFGIPYSLTYEHSVRAGGLPGGVNGDAQTVNWSYEACVNFMQMILARHQGRL